MTTEGIGGAQDSSGDGVESGSPIENAMKAFPHIREIVRLIPGISHLDPETFRGLYLAGDKRVMPGIAKALSGLTPTELSMITPTLEGLSTEAVAQKINRTPKEVELIGQIALERLSLIREFPPQRADNQSPVRNRSPHETAEELRNITFREIDVMTETVRPQLAGSSEASWAKTAQALGVSIEVARILLYVGSPSSNGLSLGDFSEKAAFQSVPVWTIIPALRNVRRTLLFTNSLYHAFVGADPRNNNWLMAQLDQDTLGAKRRKPPSHAKVRL